MMPYPSVSDRVRVSGREGEFIIVRVYHRVCAVDLCTRTGRVAIEENVSFHDLLASADVTSEATDSEMEDVGSSRNLVAASKVQLATANATIADLRDLVESTHRIIVTSQECIAESDRVIARARLGTLPWQQADE